MMLQILYELGHKNSKFGVAFLILSYKNKF